MCRPAGHGDCSRQPHDRRYAVAALVLPARGGAPAQGAVNRRPTHPGHGAAH